MANQTEKYIKDMAFSAGVSAPANLPLNKPSQYNDRQHQYMARQTVKYVDDRAKYASDYVKARVQGLARDDFYTWLTTFIRLADIAALSASASKNIDDIKVILFKEPSIDYFPIGAKIETMGSTWLCTNPSNLSSVHGTAIVQRCNAAYNSYDYYGNIVTEPIVVEKALMASNDNNSPQNIVLMDGYFNVTCQLNDNTKWLGQNQRLILGSKAYHITGYTDFIQEFTGDYESIHILKFTIRVEEPTVDDDMVNHIANGHNYTFEAQIYGADTVRVGEPSQLNAVFIKNGSAVSPTQEHPQTWVWESANEAIATVDENGILTALSPGETIVTARLLEATGDKSLDTEVLNANLSVELQNGKLYAQYPRGYGGSTFTMSGSTLNAQTPNGIVPAEFELSDEATEQDDGVVYATVPAQGLVIATYRVVVTAQESACVQFIGNIPLSITQYRSTVLQAGYYENGVLSGETVEWSFSGAQESAYHAVVDGNQVSITCLLPDSTPLHITASYGEYSAEADIVLEGY